nr:hypothetical protein [Tanacetum cinerariifolium]
MDEQERVDMEKALELQRQLDEKEDDIHWSVVAEQVKERQSDSSKRYQDLKKKPVSVAQARKNVMIYLKNMAGYKMKFFKGMTYDEIRPIFEREYNKDNNLKQALGFQNHYYLKKAQQYRSIMYDSNVIAKETNVISIADSEETLMLKEESQSKMISKQYDLMVLEKKVNTKPIDYVELN